MDEGTPKEEPKKPIDLESLRTRLSKTEGMYNNLPVLVEVFDEEGENHLAPLTIVDIEFRCADEPALFLAGRIEDEELAEEADHVDTYIWKRHAPFDKKISTYAQWMLMHFRLPAANQHAWKPFLGDKKLFCTYEGKRYRCVGASRYGDVWLVEDFKRDHGHDIRASINKCSGWSAEP